MTTSRIDATHQVETAETDTTKRLAPDGVGGVQWATAASTGIWYPVTVFDPTTGNYLLLTDGSGNAIMTEA